MISSRRTIQLIVMLDAAGWRRDAIHQIIEELRLVRSYDIDKILSATSDFARYLRHSVVENYEPVVRRVDSSEGVGKRVQALLKDDVGMTNLEAVKRLSMQLINSNPSNANSIPKYSKTSLSDWVDKVARIYPAREILHAATVIRNQYIHGGDMDWKLRK